MPAKSWAIIYSPKEGSTSTHKRWKKIRRYMEQKGLLFDFVQSEGPGSVERLASMMTRSGYRTILVVGGDAALNHALCGIMNTPCPDGKHPALGVIPNGFGNDCAKYWGMTPDNYKQTIDGLIYHHTRKIDVGRLRLYSHNQLENTTFFLNCANLGVAASITNLRRRTSKLFGLKTLSYFASAISLIFKQMNFKYHFKLSGEDVKQSAMTLCIGSAHGYGQTPSAVPYNGQLDLTLVSKPLPMQLFQGLWLLFTGRFLTMQGVKVWRTSHIHFPALLHIPLSVDGRMIHETPQSLDIDILPEEIEFLIP